MAFPLPSVAHVWSTVLGWQTQNSSTCPLQLSSTLLMQTSAWAGDWAGASSLQSSAGRAFASFHFVAGQQAVGVVPIVHPVSGPLVQASGAVAGAAHACTRS
jgi:hypothetical protein